jgi:hypothetical protein
MSLPTPDQLNDILEQCILRLQNGEALETVLADQPDASADLRPALETILAVWASRGSDTVPVTAMMRSRARLISAARNLDTRPRPSLARVRWVLFSGWVSRFRFALVPLAGLLLVASILFTGLASAHALPGQAFYPVKIAAERIRLSFATSAADRLAQEEILDLKRREEAEALIVQNREEEIYLTGFLTYDASVGWRIDELKVSMPADMLPNLQVLQDHYVYLHADLLSSGELVAEWVEPRVYLITGRIGALEGPRVLVGDVWLQVSADQLAVLQAGQTVRVSVTRLLDGELTALKIEIIAQAPTPSSSAPILMPSETSEPDTGGGDNPTGEQQPSNPDDKEKHDDDHDEEKKDSSSSEEHGDEQKDGIEEAQTTKAAPQPTRTPEPTRRKH